MFAIIVSVTSHSSYLNSIYFLICHRWAVKQEDFLNMGQWKYSTISNPEWNKRALSWPVNDDGTWNMVTNMKRDHMMLCLPLYLKLLSVKCEFCC